MQAPGEDPKDLIAPSLSNVDGWLAAYGERSAYRVRGLEWLRENVVRDIDKLKPFLEEMEALRLTRTQWQIPGNEWEQQLSIAQVYKAKNKTPLKFAKAAKVLLLCEVAAVKKGIPAPVVYSRMRIEPAIFGIADLTPALLQQARGIKENLNGVLRRGTGQQTAEVFDDMAAGRAVSYRLAWLTRALLVANVPTVPWDNVIALQEIPGGPKVSVVQKEVIEGASVPTGAPDPFEP